MFHFTRICWDSDFEAHFKQIFIENQILFLHIFECCIHCSFFLYRFQSFNSDVNQNIDSFECSTDGQCNQNTICRERKCVCSKGYKRLADNSTCILINTDVINGEHNQSKSKCAWSLFSPLFCLIQIHFEWVLTSPPGD